MVATTNLKRMLQEQQAKEGEFFDAKLASTKDYNWL